MITISLEGIGISELAADLHKAGPVAEAKTKVVIQKSGHDIVARSQTICPVDTGNLKNSIGVDFGGLGWEAGPTAHYGGYVEYGTRYMAPQAYMGPAFEQVTGEVESLFGQIAEGIL
jgi:HK97 gp10 family phage protein